MAKKKINTFRDAVGEWTDEQFPGQPAINPLVGADEERGESIARFVIKTNQGIRTDDIDDEYMETELADVGIFYADVCYRMPIDMAYYPEWSPITIDTRVDAWRESLYAYTDLVKAHHAGRHTQYHGDVFLSVLNKVCEFLGYDLEECMDERFVDIADREWDSIYKRREQGVGDD